MEIFYWYVLIICLLLQAYFVLVYFLPLLSERRKPKRSPINVSIIVCAKNEAENLKKNLPFLLKQHYEKFEVILMDDHSDDDSPRVVKNLAKTDPRLKYVKASPSIREKKGKKWALSEAIEQASYDFILLTDADCKPSSLRWLEEMSAHFTARINIVLGLGRYERTEAWHDRLVQYESLFTAITYLGFALKGKAYMGVGRNLAYRKSLFSPELMTAENIASGDDDLFIQKVARGDNVAICTDARAQTISAPPETYLKWIRQKTRHYSAGHKYSISNKLRLALLKSAFYLPNLLILVLSMAGFYPTLLLTVLVMRWLIWALLFNALGRKLGFTRTFYLLPFIELYFTLFDLWIAIKSKTGTQSDWK